MSSKVLFSPLLDFFADAFGYLTADGEGEENEHVPTSLDVPGTVQRIFSALTTTSPNALLLASLDAARACFDCDTQYRADTDADYDADADPSSTMGPPAASCSGSSNSSSNINSSSRSSRSRSRSRSSSSRPRSFPAVQRVQTGRSAGRAALADTVAATQRLRQNLRAEGRFRRRCAQYYHLLSVHLV